MEFRKNLSEKNLRIIGIERDKSIPLFTFQRNGVEVNSRLPPRSQNPLQLKKLAKNFKISDFPAKSLAKVASNQKILPPLNEPITKKPSFKEIDEFGRNLLQSDCQPSRKKEYSESDLLNYSYSEKKQCKKNEESKKNKSNDPKNSSLCTPRGETLHFFTEGDLISTPTFKEEKNMTECIKNKPNFTGSEIGFGSSHGELPLIVRNKLPEMPLFFNRLGVKNGGGKLELQGNKLQRMNFGREEFGESDFDEKRKRVNALQNQNLKANHLKIKVLNRGLPKDVFTTSDYAYKYS